jgi:hypothetical protein
MLSKHEIKNPFLLSFHSLSQCGDFPAFHPVFFRLSIRILLWESQNLEMQKGKYIGNIGKI